MPKRKSREVRVRELKAEIVRLSEEVELLKALATHDELTGILNRRGFKKTVEPILESVKALRSGLERRKKFHFHRFALIIFDVDDFKKLNSRHGHRGGDAVLQAFANLLKGRARGVDVVARWGGEEFVFGLVDAGIEDAFRVAEDIRIKVKNLLVVWHPKPGEGRSATFTVSAGVADFTTAHDLSEAIEQADSMLMKVKQTGKNRVAVYGKPLYPELRAMK